MEAELAIVEAPRAEEAAEDRLLAAFAAGQAAAFEVLYRRHAAAVHGLVYRLTGRRSEAEELTQETFVRAWQHRNTFESGDHLLNWLRRVAVNLSVNGRLKVLGATASVELESMTGGLEVEGRTPSLALITVSGPILARGVTGEISVETTSGEVRVEGSEIHRFEVDSTTGKVAFKGTLASQGEVEIETFSGAVRLELPRATRAAFELRSFGGAIKSDFCQGTPETRERLEPFRTLRCSTADEGAEIHVSTHDGEILVAAAE